MGVVFWVACYSQGYSGGNLEGSPVAAWGWPGVSLGIIEEVYWGSLGGSQGVRLEGSDQGGSPGLVQGVVQG